MLHSKIYIFFISLLTLLTLSLPLLAEFIILVSAESTKLYRFKFFEYQFEVSHGDIFLIQSIGIMTIVFLTFLIQYFNIYRPFKNFNDLRRESFKHTFNGPIKNLENQISDIRLNVMRVKTYLNIFGVIYIRKAYPIFHIGFKQEHKDKYTNFWIIKFFRWERAQGICGLSVIKEEPLVGDLRKQEENDYHLSKHKLELTKDIRLVFSFPIIKWFDKKYKVVGVVNIDTQDGDFATFLLSDDGRNLMGDILNHFKNYSYFVSYWI